MNKKPKVKHKLPNARQQALMKNLALGMTQKDAAIKAGYTTKHPRKAAHQALQQIAKTWPDELESVVGTPRQVIDKYLLPLMNAEESKPFNHNGRVIYSKPQVAWGPRYNGLDIYCRIAGAYQRDKDVESGPVQVQVITNVKLPDPQMILPVPVCSNGHKPTQGK
jgi:hypothetical protein